MFLRAFSIALRPRHRAIIFPSQLNRRSLADQQTPFPTHFQPPPSPPPYKPRYFRSAFYAIAFFSVGYVLTASTPRTMLGVGRTFADPSSTEDLEWRETLSKQLDNLPIVKNLRSEPEWHEWQAYSSFSDEEKKHRLTSGPMGGARGVGMQRVFWDEEGKRAVTIMWFGDAVSGWPNTTHGGALSTVMDESLGRVALRSFPAGTGVTANLDMNFRKPVRPGRWYVLSAQAREATERKATIVGRLEDIEGRVCVEATGIFVVPKTMTLGKITGQF